VGSLSRYDLRPRSLNIVANGTSARSIPQTPLSEFRPHVADPRPSDTVASKICEPLVDRDFETGSLYIFDRASSAGHVKIGWTAKSVPHRLEDWSKCGYEPNLLFEAHSVPHAQRAETLTHYQLIREGVWEESPGVVPGYKGTSSAGARWLGIIYDGKYTV
jgi:hypothetical protein